MRVELHREFKPVREYKGTKIVEDTGRNYVDVYFDNGQVLVMGYISRDPTDCSWSPCHKAPKSVLKQIQQCINEIRKESSEAPEILASTVEKRQRDESSG